MTATVLRGGRVLTCDGTGRVVESLAISEGRVIAAGQEDEVRAAAGPGAAVADLDGPLLARLIDTHPRRTYAGAKNSASSSPTSCGTSSWMKWPRPGSVVTTAWGRSPATRFMVAATSGRARSSSP